MTHLPPPWSRGLPGTVVPKPPPRPWRPDRALAALNAGYVGPTTAPPAPELCHGTYFYARGWEKIPLDQCVGEPPIDGGTISMWKCSVSILSLQ